MYKNKVIEGKQGKR